LKNKGQQELLFPEGIYNNISEYNVAQVKAEEGHFPLSQLEGERLLTQNIVANYAHSDLELLPGCKRLVEELQQSHIFTLAIASSSPLEALNPKIIEAELTLHGKQG